MEILFVEDEQELAGVGANQLRAKGYVVHVANNITEAQSLIDKPGSKIDYVISDHRLPDGLGIEFIIQLRDVRPNFRCAVVSGCLTTEDVERLESRQIPYYRKPLLYTRVIRDLRMKCAMQSKLERAALSDNDQATEKDVDDTPPAKEKFRFWPFGKSNRR